MPIKFRDDCDPSAVNAALSYDEDNGRLSWKRRSDMSAQWNSRYAGKPAGTSTACGYIQISLHNRLYRAHRLAWVLMTGAWPRSEIDHRNGIRSDNCWQNLREASRSENNLNITTSGRSKSGFRGVSFDKAMGRWVARAMIGGAYKVLGYRDTAEEAAALHRCAAEIHHAEFSYTKRSA